MIMEKEQFDIKHARLEQLQRIINDMTVGERYSNNGQDIIDQFSDLLDELRNTEYPITIKFW